MSQIDLSKPIFLNFNQSKFWEISLLNGDKTQIRYGKLVQGEEIGEKTQTVVKQHKNTDACLNYIIRVIENKKLKGYQGEIANSVPKVIVPQNNSQGFMIQVSAPKTEEEIKNQTDIKTQAYLQFNKSWSSKFVILTVIGIEVEEITGQLGLKNTWKKQVTQNSSNQSALDQFEETVQTYEHCGYKHEDQQYKVQLEEFNKHKDFSQNDTYSNLIIPSQKKPANQQNSRKKMDDSHSNISGQSDISDLSDLTNVSLGSQMDLSFDQQDEDDDSTSSQKIVVTGKISYGSLGPNGQLDGGVLLAQQMPDNFDPTGWYGSEKMDGVRAIWTGSTFYSRNGNEFYPPDFFIEKFPNCTLDGELFTKRDDFQRCVGIVKTKHGNKEKDERWKEIVYLVYDCPKLKKPFKDRIKALQEEIPKIGSKYIQVLPHILITDGDHLDVQLEKILKKDGEGVMLRDPNSFYEQRRSKTLLKVKTFTDEEATVIAHEKGEGRCSDMMGAMVCRLKNGIEFKIGSGFDDKQRKRPPKIGSVITFKYQNLTKDKKPRFPIFLRIKEDE